MSFLFGEPKLSKKESSECMVWLGKHYEFTAFQTREADLHNAALVEFQNSLLHNAALVDSGNSLGTDAERAVSQDMRALLRAGHREVQASTEIISRMESMESVPEAASALHREWLVIMASHELYAKARYALYKSIEKGMEPDQDSVYRHSQALEDNRRKAQKEESKLLKRMVNSGAAMRDMQKLIVNAERAVAAENWQPSQD